MQCFWMVHSMGYSMNIPATSRYGRLWFVQKTNYTAARAMSHSFDKAYKYHSLPTHMNRKKSHWSTTRDISYSGWLWGMGGGKAKEPSNCLQRCIISEMTQSVCLCMQLPGYWLFVFLHSISRRKWIIYFCYETVTC